MKEVLRTWSPYQEAIFDEIKNGTGSLAVNAVAGSGKTTTIQEAGNRLSGRQKASAIFTAFNVAIRDEMAKRLPADMEVANFHRIGRRTLVSATGHKFMGKTGLNNYKYHNLMQDLNGGREVAENRKCSAGAALISKVMQTLADTDPVSLQNLADEYDIEFFPEFEHQIPQAFNQGLRMALDGHSINFDEMLFVPVFCQQDVQTYGMIFVDECQDLSPVQQALVLMMGNNKNTRVIAVGDPRQAIYGFAGADVDSFYTVKSTFSASELPLSVCYRCPSSHLEMARQIVPNIEAAPNAISGIVEELKYKEALQVVDPWTDDLILSRTSAPLVRMMFDLIKRRVPAQIKGGMQVLQGIISLARKLEAMAGHCESKEELWFEVQKILPEYQISEEEKMKKSAVVQYQKLDIFVDKCETLDFLLEEATVDGVRSVAEFETWMKKVFDKETQGQVVLSTIHRAKGLEADRVFILDPGKTPHPMAKTPEAYAQEMNLKYVSLTRAKKALYLVEPKESMRGLATFA
jgi:DNA helicase-2/ATP-dependent DNA helicase PcrA